MTDLTFPNFRNRLVALALSDDPETPFTILEQTRFELQGGRVFLTGIVPEGVHEDNWCAGVACAVAWEAVLEYYLFDSVDDYLEKIGEV
jgi:hypothetical protein